MSRAKQVRFCQILQNSCLDYDFFLLVDLAEFTGRHASFGLENPVEVGQVVEAALVADLGDVLRGVYQLAGGLAEPDVDQVAGEGAGGVLPEKPAERARAHPDHAGHHLQGERLGIMLVDSS